MQCALYSYHDAHAHTDFVEFIQDIFKHRACLGPVMPVLPIHPQIALLLLIPSASELPVPHM